MSMTLHATPTVLRPRRTAVCGWRVVLSALATFSLALIHPAEIAARSPQPPTTGAVVDTLSDTGRVRATSDSNGAGVAGIDTVEPVSLTRAVQDENIRNELQAIFDRVPLLNRIDVDVDAGVVRLEGTVLSGESRSQAAELAASFDGVRFVDNRISESTSLDEQLEPTWTRLRELWFGTIAKLPLLVVALLIIVFASWAGSQLARWSGPGFLRTRNPFLQNLIRRFLQGAIVLLGLLLAFDLLDATALIGALVGTAGVAGLAIGFAFKDIAENYIAGLLLAVRQPFAENDRIRVEDFEGKIVRLTPRETILMTLDGNHVRIPNALIFRNPLINFTRNPLRRFQFDAGLGPNDDLALAREVGTAALESIPSVLADPAPQVLILDLGDSATTLRFTAWLDQRLHEFDRVRSEAIRIVKLQLEDAGLTMPAPEFVLDVRGALIPTPDGAPAVAARTVPSAAARPDTAKPTPLSLTLADVSVDRSVDQQIQADRQRDDEENLLDQSSVAAGDQPTILPPATVPAAPPNRGGSSGAPDTDRAP